MEGVNPAKVPVSGFSDGDHPTLGSHVLDRIVVLWNGDIQFSCGEPSGSDIIGNIEGLSLVEAYKTRMKALVLV